MACALNKPAGAGGRTFRIQLLFIIFIEAAVGNTPSALLSKLPIHFEPSDSGAYIARALNYSMIVNSTGVHVWASRGQQATSRIDMEWRGARQGTRIDARQRLEGNTNYLIGDPALWKRDVPTYAQIHFTGLYPHTDLDFYGTAGKLEYDFVLRPGADVKAIRLSVRGQQGLRLSSQGDVSIQVDGIEIVQHKPICYQLIQGKRHLIEGRYVLEGDTIGFKVGKYDRRQPLVIDPTLTYSAAMGGTGTDSALGVAVDSFGNVYVAGSTLSQDFPITHGIGSTGPSNDVFVFKLNAAGTGLVYSTYIGGRGLNSGRGIAVDSQGNAVIAGSTVSQDFPTTAGAFVSVASGWGSGFVAKLNANGNGLVFSTLVGGITATSSGTAVAFDPTGNVYAAGDTQCTDFPTSTNAYQKSLSRLQDGWVVKFGPSGNMLYSTLLGGDSWDFITAATADAAGSAYLTGYTNSANFPTTQSAYLPTNPYAQSNADTAFVTKLNPNGDTLAFSTYFYQPDAPSPASGIGIDSSLNVYIAGSGFVPTTPGSFRTGPDSCCGFVAKFDPTGSKLLYSTYIGGTQNAVTGLAVDAAGNALIGGWTSSTDFPLTTDALQVASIAQNGGTSGFVTKLNPDGTAVLYSTYLGDRAVPSYGISPSVALDSTGIYVTGNNYGWLPLTPGSYQSAPGKDIFMIKIADQSSCSLSINGSSKDFGLTADSILVNVDGPLGCNWWVENSAPWVTVDKTSGTGPGTVRVSVAANPSPARNVKLSIAGQPFTVSQPYGCTFALPVTSQSFTASGTSTYGIGHASFHINTGAGCTFTPTTSASWITLWAWGVGNSGGDVSYDVDAYNGTTSRTGTITVAGQIFTVTEGIVPCNFQLSTTKISAGPGPFSGTITVTTDPTCVWTDYSQANWLFVGANSGQGNGTLSYSGIQNLFPARIGQILIAGQVIVVTQSGGVALGDFNGDGTADLVWQDPVTGMSQVWFLGGAQGTNITGAAGLSGPNAWRIVGVADLNGDGHPDLIWQDPATGTSQVWFLGGAQGTTILGAAGLSGPNAWRIVGVADLNGDGYPDLIWQDPVTGVSQVWFLGGAQGTNIIGAAGLSGPNTWRIVALSDLNGDGHPDAIWQDPATGMSQVWFLGGAQGTTITGAAGLSGPNAWRIVGAVDFNGDGHPDLIWQDPVTGTSQMWFQGGTQGTTFLAAAALSGPNTWRIKE